MLLTCAICIHFDALQLIRITFDTYHHRKTQFIRKNFTKLCECACAILSCDLHDWFKTIHFWFSHLFVRIPTPTFVRPMNFSCSADVLVLYTACNFYCGYGNAMSFSLLSTRPKVCSYGWISLQNNAFIICSNQTNVRYAVLLHLFIPLIAHSWKNQQMAKTNNDKTKKTYFV